MLTMLNDHGLTVHDSLLELGELAVLSSSIAILPIGHLNRLLRNQQDHVLDEIFDLSQQACDFLCTYNAATYPAMLPVIFPICRRCGCMTLAGKIIQPPEALHPAKLAHEI
jgi:hypothetical protein